VDEQLQRRIEKALRNQPRSNTPLLVRAPLSSPLFSRSPQAVAAAKQSEDRAHAYIAAAIDFLYQTGENAMRERTRRLLGLNSKAL
jgi:hypothetical protein